MNTVFDEGSEPLGENDCSQCGNQVEEEHVRIQLTHTDGYSNVLRFHNLCYLANCDQLLKDLEMCGVKMVEL